MEIAYWLVAGPLTLFYLYSGGKKLAQSPEELRPMMAWVDEMPLPRVRTIGLLEMLGAIGLVLPPLVGVATWLSVAAAAGLVVLQLLATAFHLRRGDGVSGSALNVVLLVWAAVVAWLATAW
ncbi:DoxX family protein [Spongisporangium articulatum]|uniref:DoxX family protein n=1 Tax=Spongisporangium articulatum TaxID=3362603 RepID=A0ABW8AKU9_9ACTN